ncbi:hypothetical protein HPB50_007698 [Hyalomma asiaticum]|uniref:Uncharacterized protein n=1 Tax=Hyalomma asiaticum TaxID=266040 RepID=A0ACB7TK89_HYAAI|nr:hypothetical protein HPB50_007698 [Hyalomma asiaticum]
MGECNRPCEIRAPKKPVDEGTRPRPATNIHGGRLRPAAETPFAETTAIFSPLFSISADSLPTGRRDPPPKRPHRKELSRILFSHEKWTFAVHANP